jgi:arsenate reductase
MSIYSSGWLLDPSLTLTRISIFETASRKETKVSHKKKILFLCTGNSCRSQMAEGWTRALQGESFQAFSAGVDPKGVDPRAVRVMAEAGVDISAQASKSIDDLEETSFDYVVTLCDRANESCPVFFGATQRVHRGFDDPPALAVFTGSEEEALEIYRRVRDEIKELAAGLPESVEG